MRKVVDIFRHGSSLDKVIVLLCLILFIVHLVLMNFTEAFILFLGTCLAFLIVAERHERNRRSKQLEDDAGRYQWLRENWTSMTSIYPHDGRKTNIRLSIGEKWSDLTPADIDAEIDRHRGQLTSGECQ